VLANILATPLKLLAPLLCGHVAPGGTLVLAGILERQADELIPFSHRIRSHCPGQALYHPLSRGRAFKRGTQRCHPRTQPAG
jgi:hypothetical protein